VTKSDHTVFSRGQDEDDDDKQNSGAAALSQDTILNSFYTTVESKQASVSSTGIVELPTT